MRKQKETLRHAFVVLLAVLSLLAITSCSDDDDKYIPAYLVDLVEASVGTDSLVKSVRLDNGTVLKVNQQINAHATDTTLRCLCTYIVDNSVLRVYSMKTVFSKEPVAASEFSARPQAPLKFISSWRTDRYMNIRVGIMTTGTEAHSYAFSLDSMRVEQGQKKAYLTLLHYRPKDDAESFTEERFMSMPTKNYQDCDSIIIYLPTYDGWMKVVR